MSEGGYFNRAGRRSGGDPDFALAGSLAGIPSNLVAVMSAALDVKKLSDENEIPVAEVIAKARETGYINCDDKDAKWLEDFLTKDDFNPSEL
jgi:hypothetical protein